MGVCWNEYQSREFTPARYEQILSIPRFRVVSRGFSVITSISESKDESASMVLYKRFSWEESGFNKSTNVQGKLKKTLIQLAFATRATMEHSRNSWNKCLFCIPYVRISLAFLSSKNRWSDGISDFEKLISHIKTRQVHEQLF